MKNNIEDKKFLVQSFSWVAFANIITKPFWFFLFIMAARLLGVVQFGLFAYASSMIMVASLIFDFGYDYSAVREISQNKEKAFTYFTSILSIRTTAALIAAIIFCVLFSFGIIHSYKELIVILIFLAFQFLVVVLQFFKNLTTAFFDYKLFTKITLIEKFSVVIFGGIAVFVTKDIVWFLSGLVFANLFTVTVFFRKIYHLVNQLNEKLKVDFGKAFGIFKEALPIFYISVFSTMYFRTDVIIMKYIGLNQAAIGLYGSIHRLIEMYLMVPTIIMATTYPILANKYKTSFSFATEFLSKNLQILFVISLPVALIISLNYEFFNNLLFGAEYVGGSFGLSIIIWTIIPISLNYALGNVLVIVKKEKFSTYSLAISSLLGIALNVLLIPTYGFIISSILTLTLEIAIFFSYIYFVKKFFGSFRIIEPLLKTVTIIVSLFILHFLMLYLFDYSGITFIAIEIISIAALLLLTKLIDKNEIKGYITLFKS